MKLGKKFLPYTGAAGPTTSQADNNTMFLANEIEALIMYKIDHDHAKELWDGDELNLKIIHPINGKVIYVGYDRWGFVVDGDIDGHTLIDQSSIGVTIDAIKKWYNS